MSAEASGLSRERYGSPSRQSGGEPCEDHEVGVELDLLDAPDADRRESPLGALGRIFARPRVRMALEPLTGVVLIGIGARVVLLR